MLWSDDTSVLQQTATLCHLKSKEDGEAHVQMAHLDHGLALGVVVALVVVPEQRLVALHLVRPGTHGTRGAGENDGDEHEGGDYRYGDDLRQC